MYYETAVGKILVTAVIYSILLKTIRRTGRRPFAFELTDVVRFADHEIVMDAKHY